MGASPAASRSNLDDVFVIPKKRVLFLCVVSFSHKTMSSAPFCPKCPRILGYHAAGHELPRGWARNIARCWQRAAVRLGTQHRALLAASCRSRWAPALISAPPRWRRVNGRAVTSIGADRCAAGGAAGHHGRSAADCWRQLIVDNASIDNASIVIRTV